MSNNTAEVKVGADGAAAIAEMHRIESAVTGGFNRMNSSMANVNSMFTKVQGAFVAVAGAAAGAFALALKNAIDLQDEMSKGAQRAGVSTEAYSELAYVAKLADVEVGELARTFSKLAKTLDDAKSGQTAAVDLLSRLKIDTKNLKDGDDLLMALAERFSQMEDGAKKTALAIDVFGERIGPKLIPFLNAGRAGMAELREEARKLGVVVSTEAGKAAEELNDNLTRMGTAATGVASEVAKELVPGLVKASDFFVKATKEAGLFEAVLISIGALMAKALGIDEAGKLESKLASLKGEAERLKAVMVGVDNVLAREPGNELAQLRMTTLKKRLDEVNREALNVAVAIARLGSNAPDPGAGRGNVHPPGLKSQPFVPGDKPPPEPPKTNDERMAGWEAALAARRDVLERQSALEGTFHEFGKADEAKYWKDILDSLSAGDEKRSAVERKYYGAAAAVRKDAFAAELTDLNVQRENLRANYAEREKVAAESYSKIAAAYGAESKEAKSAFGVILQERRSLADQTDKIDEAAAETRYQIKQIELETERQNALTAAEIAGASAQEKLQIEQRFLDDRFELERADILRRLSTTDPSNDPEAYAALKNRLLVVEAAFQGKRSELVGQGLKADALDWKNFYSRMETGFASTIEAFAQGTMSIGSLFSNLGKTVLNSMVGMFAQIAARWLATQLIMVAAQAKASVAVVATKSTEATAVVAANAAEAGSGAAAAMASIPWVGPVLALAAMAAVFAAVSGLGKGGSTSVPSAAGGFDIPAGVNPLTQLHEREMVLPAKHADVIRGMADGQAPPQGGGGLVNINTTGGDFIHKNDLAKLLKQMNRDFVFVGHR